MNLLYGFISSIVPVVLVVVASFATAELRKNEHVHAFINWFGPEYPRTYVVPIINVAMWEDESNDRFESY